MTDTSTTGPAGPAGPAGPVNAQGQPATGNPLNNIASKVPKVSTLGLVLIGVPITIWLGGTRIAPFVNLSLAAILLLQFIKPESNPVASAPTVSGVIT